jgi:hypothetical protein
MINDIGSLVDCWCQYDPIVVIVWEGMARRDERLFPPPMGNYDGFNGGDVAAYSRPCTAQAPLTALGDTVHRSDEAATPPGQ